jgi:DNA-directed RNA polymerase subunit RPC12/RpoP
LSSNTLICPNDKCNGTDFTQVIGNQWKCVDCGTVISIGQSRQIKKKIRLPKEKNVPIIHYSPLVMICEECGEKIDRITHPKDEKQLNENWLSHSCVEKKTFYQ